MPHNRAVKTVRRAAALVLPLLVVGFLGTVAGSVATGFVRVPRVSELATYRPDIITRDHGAATARRSRATRSSGGSSSPGRRSRPSSATRSSRPRTRTSTSTAGSTCAASSRPLVVEPPARRIRAGRLDAHAAARPRRSFSRPRRRLSRKVNEALVAFEIERRYSKDQILTMYANEIYLGHGNYGVEAASRYYFGKRRRRTSRWPRRRCSPGSSSARRTSRRSATRSSRRRAARRRCGGCGTRATSRRPSARPRTPSRCPRRRRSPNRSWPRTSARRSASTSRRPTARRTSTAAACGSSRRSTRSCRRGPRRRSAGACARSRAAHGFHKPRNLIGRRVPLDSRPTSTRRGKARLVQEGQTLRGVVTSRRRRWRRGPHRRRVAGPRHAGVPLDRSRDRRPRS